MALTVQQLILAALLHADKRSLAEVDPATTSPDQRGYRADALQRLNAALQEMHGEGPAHVSKDEYDAKLRAGVAVTIAVTQDSKTTGTITTHASWMNGCTIRISGDSIDNQIVSYSGGVGALMHPHPGATGAVSATVYGDAIALPSNTVEVLPEPWLKGVRQLHPAANLSEFFATGVRYRLTDYEIEGISGNEFAVLREVDVPHTYWVQTRFLGNGTAANGEKYLRVNPLPDADYVVQMQLRYGPVAVTDADISAGAPYTDPNKIIELPIGWHERVLLPILEYQYLTSPFFQNDSARADIKERYYKALTILGRRPQQGRSRTVKVRP
jgi:hypothetical protein